MSWSWKEENEEIAKKYEQAGMVTISTEEYRDLISQVYKLQAAGQKEHDDWYKEYQRANELEKKLQLVEKKLSEFDVWFTQNTVAADDFKAWKIQKIADEQENA